MLSRSISARLASFVSSIVAATPAGYDFSQGRSSGAKASFAAETGIVAPAIPPPLTASAPRRGRRCVPSLKLADVKGFVDGPNASPTSGRGSLSVGRGGLLLRHHQIR